MANHHVLRRSKVHPLDAEFPWRLGHIVASPSSDAAKAAMNDLQAAKPCCLDAGFSAHLQPLVAASPGACLDPKTDLHQVLKAVLSRCRASNLLVEDRFARVGAHGSKRGRAASGLTVMAKHVLAEALSQWSCRAREADRGQSVAPPACLRQTEEPWVWTGGQGLAAATCCRVVFAFAGDKGRVQDERITCSRRLGFFEYKIRVLVCCKLLLTQAVSAFGLQICCPTLNLAFAGT